MINRRRALTGTALSSASLLLGCGGGGGANAAGDPVGTAGPDAQPTGTTPAPAPDLAPVTAAPPPATATPPANDAAPSTPTARQPEQALGPILPASRYRTGQRYLFQTIRSRSVPSRLAGGRDYNMEIFGPTHTYVDINCGWPWDNKGGDWLDANLVRQGVTPWFATAANLASGSTAAANYTVDVSNVLQYVQTNDRWCAFLLRCPRAPRTIAGIHQEAFPRPRITVRYQSGAEAELACRLVALVSAGSISPSTTAAEPSLPVFVEFERPASAVASASMHFTLTQHWSGSNPVLEGFLLDPPINREPALLGVANQVDRLDAGLPSQASIIGVHRYVDGSTLADFTVDKVINTGAEREFDPAIWNNGPSDTSKLPHFGLGKWIGHYPDRWSMVNSGYRGEGFEALATGLGALRVHMPKLAGVQDGTVVGYGGTGAANAFIFLPENLFGRLGRIFVRHYFRLGTPNGSPYGANPADRLHVYRDAARTDTAWTDSAGKFGVMPDHVTTYGGVSGTAGGGAGWQLRLAWGDCDAATQGPDEGGWVNGQHLYDFYYRNPPGHNYVNDARHLYMHGQRGGLGGILYADRWYCIENEVKLNTVMPESPGFVADGQLRTWIDGRLVFERTGMVFRTLPLLNVAHRSDQLRPCRELGIRSLWFNWYHGGTTANTVDRTMFVTGLAWGHEYIGPMKL